jgi:hypothetical protein
MRRRAVAGGRCWNTLLDHGQELVVSEEDEA